MTSNANARGALPAVSFEYVRPGNHRTTFHALLLHADADLVILSQQAHPSRPLYHGGRPVIESGYAVVWFLLQGQPYDIGRFYQPDGTWTGYYVDILEPVRWDGAHPERIPPLHDLALDLWIAPDGSYQILDEDEFEDFVRQGALTPAQSIHARSTLDELVTSVEQGTFPPTIVHDYDHPSTP